MRQIVKLCYIDSQSSCFNFIMRFCEWWVFQGRRGVGEGYVVIKENQLCLVMSPLNFNATLRKMF